MGKAQQIDIDSMDLCPLLAAAQRLAVVIEEYQSLASHPEASAVATGDLFCEFIEAAALLLLAVKRTGLGQPGKCQRSVQPDRLAAIGILADTAKSSREWIENNGEQQDGATVIYHQQAGGGYLQLPAMLPKQLEIGIRKLERSMSADVPARPLKLAKGTSPQPKKAARIDPNEKRNKFIYTSAIKGTEWKRIVKHVLEKFGEELSVQAVRKAGNKYANDKGLDPIPQRRDY